MLRPSALLMVLSVGATLLGAKLYIDRALHASPPSESALAPDEMTLTYIEELEAELDRVRTDNAALRKLIENDGTQSLAPQLLSFVEKDLGLQLRSTPIALIRDQGVLRDASGQAWLRAFGEQQLEILSYSFDVLEILPPNQQWIGQIITAETTGSRGVYDPSTGEIVLAEGFDEENIHHQAALIRLLAIALLDQHYPLANTPSLDHFIARRALHHGRASILQDRFYTLQAKHIGFITERAPNTEAAELFSKLPVFVKNITTFANIHGKDYLNGLTNQEEIHQALESRNSSTKGILLKNHPFAEPPPLDSNPLGQNENSYTVQLNTRLGALTFQSYLDQHPSTNTIQSEWIKDLKSDQLSITTEAAKTAHTLWSFDFSHETKANEFYQWAENVVNDSASNLSISINSHSVTITHSEALEDE
ncbi:hypothetical protein [Rubritalea sp.]|uniref:hypothetical protein n=1 Tax=Rubritalea sp. TaxID=2109375 RepID=UPI003EF43658